MISKRRNFFGNFYEIFQTGIKENSFVSIQSCPGGLTLGSSRDKTEFCFKINSFQHRIEHSSNWSSFSISGDIALKSRIEFIEKSVYKIPTKTNSTKIQSFFLIGLGRDNKKVATTAVECTLGECEPFFTHTDIVSSTHLHIDILEYVRYTYDTLPTTLPKAEARHLKMHWMQFSCMRSMREYYTIRYEWQSISKRFFWKKKKKEYY